jgi:hypothetical protein
LKLPLPPAREPLDELGHPILAKAREHFADDKAGHERIRSVDDEVLFKVKIRRWRGATVDPVGLEPTTNGLKVHCSAN